MNYSDVFDEPLQTSNTILVNTPPSHLTVKAPVYITAIGGVAHAYPSSGNHLLYRNKQLTIWNEFYKMATWDNRVLSVMIKFNVS